MLYYIKKFNTVFLFYVLIIIKTIKGDEEYISPNDLGNKISGFLGYKCNFSTKGVHNLEPDILEYRSVFCSVNSYFIYDKIRLMIPKNDKTSKFKILPGSCFQKVYVDFDKRVETDISDLGLVEYEVNEDDSSPDYTEKTITISPFNNTDVEFFCFCDNTGKVVSDVEGRSALVYVHVLKYPHDIISINLTNDSFPYLKNPKSKEDFEHNSLEVELKSGELLVLACELIDKECFQKPKYNDLYKSNKIIYHKKFAIFKAPSYTKAGDMDAACTCKADSIVYSIIAKPKEEKKMIHGCDFSTDDASEQFSNSVNLKKAEDNTPVNCEIDLKEKTYNHLIGLKCPGEIIPDCFFQVYQQEKEQLEPSKIVYLDAHLNVGHIEYFEDSKVEDKVKIFGIVGSVPKDTTFVCLCKNGKKTGYMTVKIASGYYGFLAKIFIFLIVIILLYV
ncbi:6-cysteine protein, putative [Plasmodium gallinaceum]|uniref:6-cysteine protein, putative n=1 Tax=Plasmodium gallinaceum TaxID=5849 RepID=A0A1J1GRS7_PLAGA|nr:6-cysteine protein, putative [Plasmodium gallinaceum]CRG95173.1 6-cysteine protein, putative [Plasmodium gallinaceum]